MLLRLVGHTAGQVIDDRALRLPVAVEPVVGNHSSREDDANPQDKRERAGNPGRSRRRAGHIPRGYAAINARVKNPYVEPGQQKHSHFDPEENILVGPQWDRGKEQRSANDHDHEAQYGPWQKAPSDFRNRHAAHRPTKQAQVEHDRQAEEKSQSPYMNRFDQVIGIAGFVEADAPRGIPQAAEESKK